ncbi:nitric oxide synthase oxygenase [Rossellomorea sp. LjRoot5]
MRVVKPHLALQVPLRHPEFDWFGDLGLKWHGVPIITVAAWTLHNIETRT